MIIGRTSFYAEKRSFKSTLTKNKYFEISHLSRDFIINNKIRVLPVSLNTIIKQNGWKTVPYKALNKFKIKEFLILAKHNLGFTELTSKGEYIIFYDDSKDINTQRFTIAHEIGHIILNHFKILSENREQEANMFAARLLMPMCVLYECKIKTPQEIQKMCKVSEMSAKYRFVRFEMLKQRKKFYTDKNEKLLRKSFKKYIKEYLKNEKDDK